MLAWLDLGRTRGKAMSGGKGTLVEERTFGSCQRHDHLGEE